MRDRAYVVFSGKAEFWWQYFLRPGFRHCAVIVQCMDYWLAVEPLSSRLQLRVLSHTGPEMSAFLSQRGLIVLETSVRAARATLKMPSIWSCVEVAKLVLGIESIMIQTPWQLHRYLREQSKKIP